MIEKEILDQENATGKEGMEKCTNMEKEREQQNSLKQEALNKEINCEEVVLNECGRIKKYNDVRNETDKQYD